jgi:hypothetical protein
MNVAALTRKFASERGIGLSPLQNGCSGRRGRVLVGYDNFMEDKLVVKKRFPIKGMNESRIIITDDFTEVMLDLKILYGCLGDYVRALDGAEDELCQFVQKMLFHYLGRDTDPTDYVRDQLPLEQEFWGGLPILLDRFYTRRPRIN